ncbi:hypothetical protein Tco_0091194 [Tanacetum coccineum]
MVLRAENNADISSSLFLLELSIFYALPLQNWQVTWVCLTISGLLTPGRCKRWRSRKGKSSGSGSGSGPEVSAPSAGENVVAKENVIPVGAYVDLVDPKGDLTSGLKRRCPLKAAGEAKRKKLSKQSDPLPAKRLRIDHPSLASGTGGKTLASLRRTIPEGSLLLGSSPADVYTQVTVRSSRVADTPVPEKLLVLKSLVKEKERVRGVRPIADSQSCCDEARNFDFHSLIPERDRLLPLRIVETHPLSAVVAYNPETAESNYLTSAIVFIYGWNGPLANLPEAAHLQPCLEQLSVPIYHADVNVVVGETSLSFALLNVHTRAEGAKRHASALRQLMVDIVSHPLSSQNLLGEASTSSALAPALKELEHDEDLGVWFVCPN